MMLLLVICRTFRRHLPSRQPADLLDDPGSTEPAEQTDRPAPYAVAPTSDIHTSITDRPLETNSQCGSNTTTAVLLLALFSLGNIMPHFHKIPLTAENGKMAPYL